MIKKFYVFAWFLLIGSALSSLFTVGFDAMTMLAASLGAVVLVYVFALWAVLRNPQRPLHN